MREKYSKECIDFIERLVTDAGHRMGREGVEEIMQHPWLR